MDIIIGVDVQDDLKDRKALESAPEILLQINNFRTIEAMQSKRALTDIYIKPDITNYSVISFDDGKNIIKNGVIAAHKKISALKDLKTKQPQFYNKPNIKITDSITIRKVKVSGNNRYTRSYIIGKLKIKSNSKIGYNQLNKGVNNLVATNNFETFRYKINKTEADDVFDLDAKVKESKISTFVKLGVHYDGLYKSAALVNFTKKRLLSKNDVASLDLVFGR